MAKEWVGKSVEDLGFHYEKMMPDYDLKENLMSTLICMFDSGYTLPQGREVINYFYPLNYGLDGIIEMAKECKRQLQEMHLEMGLLVWTVYIFMRLLFKLLKDYKLGF